MFLLWGPVISQVLSEAGFPACVFMSTPLGQSPLQWSLSTMLAGHVALPGLGSFGIALCLVLPEIGKPACTQASLSGG